MNYPQNLLKMEKDERLVTIRESLKELLISMVDEIFDRYWINKEESEYFSTIDKLMSNLEKLTLQTFEELHDEKYGFDLTAIHQDYYQQCIHQSPIELELNRLELWANH